MLTPSDHDEQLPIDPSRSRLRGRRTRGAGETSIGGGIAVRGICFASGVKDGDRHGRVSWWQSAIIAVLLSGAMAIAIILAVALAAPTSALAAGATFTVTKTADTNDGACNANCSLRDAIIAANVTPGEDIIILPAGTYTTTNELDITGVGFPQVSSLHIIGAGARTTTVAGDGTSRVFDVHGEGFNSVTMSGLTVTGGGGVAQGAGIDVPEGGVSLTLRDAAVIGNSTSAPTSVSSRQGGGLFLGSYGTLNLERVLVANNTTIAQSGDTNAPQGAGIFAASKTFLTNVTIAGNTADGTLGGSGEPQGGGIFVTAVTETIMRNVTLASNHVIDTGVATQSQGPGAYVSTGILYANNTIIAENTENGDASVNQCGYSGFVSLESERSLTTTPAACGFPTASEGDPLLGPLQDNGGPTDTMEPGPGSPAIDGGTPFDECPEVECPELDQRGFTRAGHDSALTIGAVQVGATSSPVPAPIPAPISTPIIPTPPISTPIPTPISTPILALITTTPKPKATPKAISAAAAFSLPSATQCVSKRRFTIHVRTLSGITWVSAVIKINGKRIKTVGRSHIRALVNLVGLPKGTFVLSITAKASNGQSVTGTRTYHTCVPKSKSQDVAPRL